MTNEVWARVRGLFSRPTDSQRLERVFAGWRADPRTGDFESAAKRERFHPLKGWLPEDAERASAGPRAHGRFRHPANGRTGEK